MKLFYLTFLFVLITYSGFSQSISNQQIWTKEYEQSVYNWADNSLNLAFENDSLKNQYLMILVQKFKRELPGGLNSVSPDSLSKVVLKLDKECKQAINYQYLRKWTPGFEALLRKSIHDRLKSSLPKNVKDGMCNCLIIQYKKTYPKGMPGEVPNDIGDKLSAQCFYDVVHNKKYQ
ncbi:MAG: hypothetical protein JO080_08335 [Mucilaginibacter sp.]|nr:hypothetical protein [Mucilaginibacter sp.]